MRPLHLTISAFGPYSQNIQLDMDSLGDKGIYLITGPTGAGKTTIFDAISFALFGSASGEMRDPAMLRCRKADPNTPTFVKLKFLLRNEIYIIERNPKYERPTKRGNSTTTQSPNAY